jgi:pyruvate dehydrogenase E1 component beta subunit
VIEGSDVTIIAWLLMTHLSVQAARRLGAERIAAEVIDARNLAPLDWDTFAASAAKTGRVAIVEEGPRTGGVGAEIAAGLVERLPGLKIERVASPDIPVPFSPVLEDAYRPDVDRIAAAARRLSAMR